MAGVADAAFTVARDARIVAEVRFADVAHSQLRAVVQNLDSTARPNRFLSSEPDDFRRWRPGGLEKQRGRLSINYHERPRKKDYSPCMIV